MNSGGRGEAVSGRLGPRDRNRFLVGLTAALVLFGLFKLAEPRTDIWFGWANRLTADLTADLLRASGLEVERNGSIVAHPEGFGVYIYYLCTGWPLALAMVIGLVALPGRLAAKLPAAAAGAALLLAINQLRLVSLFWIGLRLPRAFDFAHHWVWEPVMLFTVAVMWAAWIRHRPLPGARV